MSKVVIFGNGSVARDFYFCLKYFSEHEIAGFAVDAEHMQSNTLLGLPVVPFRDVVQAFRPQDHTMFVAVGYVQNNRIRRDRYLQAKSFGYQTMNFVSPRAVIHPETPIGDNCFVGHNCVISPDARIGNNVIISTGCLVGHDVVVEDHCFLSPCVSVAGVVNIGSGTFLGIGATVRNKLTIGKECVIGAGAVILADAADRSVHLGTPATVLPIASDELPLT